MNYIVYLSIGVSGLLLLLYYIFPKLSKWAEKVKAEDEEYNRMVASKERARSRAIKLQTAYWMENSISIELARREFIEAVKNLNPNLSNEEAMKSYPGWLAAALHC